MGVMKYLVVSVHDAAPPYLDELRNISSWLDDHSVSPRCIKVIPNYLGQWNILEHEDFLAWLKEERDKGSEIIQHGYVHTGREKAGSLGHRLRDRFITRQNAEFISADYEQARAAIENGQNILKEANFHCPGFTSPTWYQSSETDKALSDCGFLYYTSYSWILDGRKGKHVLSSAMGDLGLGFPLGQMNIMGNVFMAATGFRCSPLARIVLHPQTPPETLPFTHALNSILRLARKREIVTYKHFIES